ncbi:ATPase AAA [Spirochaetia bacterium]|nr:ATPase AAA [Spirochaetia bacterium]
MPIGVQDFEKLRTKDCVYIDKTAYIYQMTQEVSPYFLGRPRRFGKSLLLSTIKAYFLGKEELFEGLAIANLEADWLEYPVFHIDLNIAKYDSLEALQSGLDANLRYLEDQWGQNTKDNTISTRFYGLIRRTYEKTGKKVVVLIDEYDRPLVQALDNEALLKTFRSELKAFYGVLKTADPYLRFVLLTGVTKFSKVSVFSDLNQLRDISMSKAYSEICGISEAELIANFDPELHILAVQNQMTYEEALLEMRKRFNGYHFCENGTGIYNPFSVLNTFADNQFKYYWFQTGTPTFLVNLLKNADFDIRAFDTGITINSRSIDDYRTGNSDPTPLLYQSGYLTIKNYDRELDEYTLGFPNEEVEYGFLEELLPLYTHKQETDPQGFSIQKFYKDLRDRDVDGFMARLRAFFADIPYELNDKTERHYQALFYITFRLMGQFAQVEVRSAKGRADIIVTTKDTIYVFEFKLAGNGTVEEALKQIDEKGYLIPYSAGKLKLVKVGAEFDPAERTISRWKFEKTDNP